MRPHSSSWSDLQRRGGQIRMLALDVDGVLTDGRLWYSPSGEALKVFDVYDGQGLAALKEAGFMLAILSGRSGDAVARRAEDLRFDEVALGLSDKGAALDDLLVRHQLSEEQICFVGDDLPDLPVLSRVGLPLTVPAAPEAVRSVALAVTEAAGGRGAVREVCDFLLATQSS